MSALILILLAWLAVGFYASFKIDTDDDGVLTLGGLLVCILGSITGPIMLIVALATGSIRFGNIVVWRRKKR